MKIDATPNEKRTFTESQTAFTSDVVVGLEIHVELKTKTKLFCGCARVGSDVPNTRTCPTCLGHPGSRPVLNRKAVDFAIKIARALGCTITDELVFSRKAYFYPDMSKNFQITQFEEPLGRGGNIKIRSGKVIHLERLHLEEDPASTTYPQGMAASPFSYLDYNRAGNPLVEIVTKPEMTTPAEAREFLNRLASILTYLDVFNVDQCILKADANISIKESGYTRVEIKNISGFKELENALLYEITRQRALVRRGLAIKRETRGWNEGSRTTNSQRSKETEADYGYITEPDLSLISVSQEMVALLEREIPELAHQKVERYVHTLNVEPTDAEVMAMELELAELFERVAHQINPRLAAKWLRRELLRVLNYNKKTVRDIQFSEKE
ncbi:Asp-tRNA(Asn)/Glu-tRNA(Gln) amidotransferase subunit GatB, partial [Candidatus Woesearchaeota archaeon]|nr:Asp-tRNA(Asn)/Glu-tRNA(Gln) amidotransferase subunit GatB [Candidatus Woesearchaeota archaeon]